MSLSLLLRTRDTLPGEHVPSSSYYYTGTYICTQSGNKKTQKTQKNQIGSEWEWRRRLRTGVKGNRAVVDMNTRDHGERKPVSRSCSAVPIPRPYSRLNRDRRFRTHKYAAVVAMSTFEPKRPTVNWTHKLSIEYER